MKRMELRAPVRHLVWTLVLFCLVALPHEGLRRRVATVYAGVANTVLLEHAELGRGGGLKLVADKEQHKEGSMSQDAALILSTRRKGQVMVFGVNLRRDAILPTMLAVLLSLCAPTAWTRRVAAAGMSGGVMLLLSILSYRGIAAWFFQTHGSQWMVYLPDETTTKLAKLLYKGLLSQPNYRLALGAAMAAGALWFCGYHPLRAQALDPAPWRRAIQAVRSLVARGQDPKAAGHAAGGSTPADAEPPRS